MNNLLDGKYLFSDTPVGKGKYSFIYKGINKTNNNIVAIKEIYNIINKEYIKSEIDIMRKLTHPNIVKLYDYVWKPTKIYLIIEYCNGGNLRGHSPNEKYIYQLLDVFLYLNKNGVMHRDIKPDNIFIHNGNIKLGDFGFSKMVNELCDINLNDTICGSPLYMAPEILRSDKYDNTGDIWSLGVVIYELYFGEHPYHCKTKEELYEKIIENSKDIEIDGNKDGLYNLLSIMLVKDNTNRCNWDNIENHPYTAELYRKYSTPSPNTSDSDSDSDSDSYTSYITNTPDCSPLIAPTSQPIPRKSRHIANSLPNSLPNELYDNQYINNLNSRERSLSYSLLAESPTKFGLADYLTSSFKKITNIIKK
jgi:serine/threonine protein kinase